MIDSIYQAGTDQALDDQLQRPKPFKADEPKFSLGGMARGAALGVGGGVANTIAFGAEITGAFGSVAGAGGFNGGGMFSTPTDAERKQQEDARRKLLQQGPEYSNEAGDTFRQRAKDIMPDPTATHAAEQVTAGLTQFATQAVGYSVAGGPVAGAALLGGDAAFAEADKLKQQGVDLATRAKVGAVSGVTAAVSVALPVVGKTAAQTVGLVAAGGPGGFIAQNAASKAILDHADYQKIGSQYDALDPVGLALSTIVPAGFGAIGLRGAARARNAATLKEVVLGIESNGQRYAKDGSVLTSPKGAKGEMQVMDKTNLDPGFGVRPAADNSLAERARVGSDYLDAMLARYGSEDKAMAAYNAGPGAVDAALKKGGDWLGHLPAETQAYVTKGMKKLGDGRTGEVARAAIARDPDTVAAARVRQTTETIDSYRLTPDSDLAGQTAHSDAMERAHEQLARGEPVSVSDLMARSAEAARPESVVSVAPDVKPGVNALPEPVSARLRATDGTEFAVERDFRGKYTAKNDAGEVMGSVIYTDTPQGNYRVTGVEVKPAFQRQGVASAMYDFLESAVTGRPMESSGSQSPAGAAFREARTARAAEAAARSPEARIDAVSKGADELRAVVAERPSGRQLYEAAGDSPITPERTAAPGATSTADAAAAKLDTRATEIAELNPDLMVQLEGMDKPMRVSELLEQVKKEADEETKGASLVEVAANCLLRSA